MRSPRWIRQSIREAPFTHAIHSKQGTFASLIKICRIFSERICQALSRNFNMFLGFTSWGLGRIQKSLQNYKKFCTYANLFVLLLGIHRNIRATLVKLVDMDVVLGHIGDDDGCFGELVDVVESVEVLAQFIEHSLLGCRALVI